MSEQDPGLPLEFNQEPFEATRHNTTIFTYFGQLAMYNHVFVQTRAEEQSMIGAYVFCDHPAFQYITSHAMEYDWPMVLNRNEVPECDMTAWDNAHLGDLRGTDSFPDEWQEDGAK